MAKVQSRRTIGFNRAVYKRVIAEAAKANQSGVQWVTLLVLAELERLGRPLRDRLVFVPPDYAPKPRPPRRLRRGRPKSARRLAHEFMAGVLP